MKNRISIKKKIKPFNKILKIEGDKSLSIRWALLASQAKGKSISYNLLRSEDVINTLKCLKKLGVKVNFFKNKCEIISNGLNCFNYKKKLTLNAGNSGTLARLILGLLVHSKNKIIIKGDKSLSKRDFLRVINPLKNFGAKLNSNNGKLPVEIIGTNNAKPVNYFEKKVQKCKALFGGIKYQGALYKKQKIRNHSGIFSYLNRILR